MIPISGARGAGAREQASEGLCMVQAHLEDANLTQRCLPNLLIFIGLLELFDRDDLARFLVACL